MVGFFGYYHAVNQLNPLAAMQVRSVWHGYDLLAAILHGDADMIVVMLPSVLSVPLVCAMLADFSGDCAGNNTAGHYVESVTSNDVDKINQAAIDAI